jgi:hypothetical protein
LKTRKEYLAGCRTVPIERKNNLPTLIFNRYQASPIDVIDIYHTRFQIEFGFKDASNSQGLKTRRPEAEISSTYISIPH